MPPEVLLIDLDGVIRHWQISDEAIESTHGLPSGSIRTAAFLPHLVNPAITGKVTDEVWRDQVAQHLQQEHGSVTAFDAVKEWTSCPGSFDSEVLAVLGGCARLVRLVLVTNATSRLTRDLQAAGLSERFHAVVNSSEIGVAKPSPTYFRIALDHAGASPQAALFVDDTLANVEAASALGIRSHHFSGTSKLRRFLEAEGVSCENAL